MKLGLDVGYGDVKAVYTNSDQLMMLKFPTAISYAESGVGELSEFAENEEYEYRNRKYLVGRSAVFAAFSTRNFEFMKRYLPLFLFKAANDVCERTGQPASDVALGLPLSHYTEANIKALTALLEQLDAERIVPQLKMRFYPQGLGVLADYRLSADGSANYLTEKDMLIIDVGFNTVDVVAAQKGKIIKNESDTLERHGVAKITMELAREIKSQMQFDLSEQEAKDVICRGKIKLYGAERDLTEMIRESAENYSDWLFQEIRSKWSARIQRAEVVIVAGGGAYYLKGNIPEEYLPIVHFPELPEFANARGFLKALNIESRA